MSGRKSLKFPERFLWGAATSAHQIEGGLHNQWTVWELENARALAAQAPYHYSDLERWPLIKKQAQNPANYVSGKAIDHYKYFREDIALLKTLNLNAYRFSIEWSSIQPEEGIWNAGEVEHYRQVLMELKRQGIEPIVTLFHFTMPIWFAKKGGFEKRSNARFFVEFVDKVMSEIGDLVTYVITINEMEVYASESYIEGRWPPQAQSRIMAHRVLRNLIYTHNKTARLLKSRSTHYQVSIAKNSVYVYPGDDSWLSIKIAGLLQYYIDDFILKRVMKQCDFIGVNYYFSNRVYGYRTHNPDEKVSDMGWDMQPANIQYVLERLYEKYKKPIFITENGLADADDNERQWWITQTIIGIQRALGSGVKIIGYLHWSLFDNFEWNKGYWPKFGLVEVDRRTMRRIPRKSAVWFGRVVKKLRGKR